MSRSTRRTHQLSLLLLQLTMLMLRIGALPTIQRQGRNSGGVANYVQQLDKSLFQPREIEQTIDEVQKILANDPALPRLTRGEIEELYEKVTREEYEKSIEAGDMSRADSMRALMLVLPYNTDNNTEENLQELYTRPPVTRVIDAYTQPDPIKFLTPDPSAVPRSTVPGGNPAVAATTYKPVYGNLPKQLYPALAATTYHPPAPAPVMYQLAPSLGNPSMDFLPVKNRPQVYDYAKAQAALTGKRFSSHYSAKNAQFLRKPKPALARSTSSSTVKPVADILESLGIVGGGGAGTNHKRYALDDYYPAESAPQPVVAMADLRGLQGARIRPDAYSNFKPLNIGEELRVKPEVEGYLARFGIVRKSSKALNKSPAAATSTEEPTGAHTELSTATAILPPQSNAELAKLLENLQKLERLQTKAATKKTLASTTTRTNTATTTSTTTTAPPPTTALPMVQLITHGAPLLIEPKKPRRRIDPNIDNNFGNAGNQQKPSSSMDELSKLIQNLQELEKLKINPENVLKATSPGTQALSNRYSISSTTPPTTSSTMLATNDARELELILSQLQQLEKKNDVRKAATISTTTSTTTKQGPAPASGLGLGLALPFNPTQAHGLGVADLAQLQRLLSDDRALERLYEQSRQSKKGKSSPSNSSTSRTTTSTSIPVHTTTSTTTPRPTKAAAAVDHAQFEALITRVQQLEQLQQPQPTTPSFSTRNVAAAQLEPSQSLPNNDFAQLQQLSATASDLNQGQVEISTAASTSKQRQRPRPLDSFERSNGLLQDVQPQDYVQLQKLLSKVQELERVQLHETSPTTGQQLVTAASVRSQNIKSLSGAQIVYAQPAALLEPEPEAELNLKLELPVYRQPAVTTPTMPKSSSEKLREFTMSQPAHPQLSSNSDADFNQYQKFFSSLEDNNERQNYHRMQPIYKTPTASPALARPQLPIDALATSRPPSKQADLAELQKLLYNTQQLQKLGVALPNELSQQLESQLQTQPRTTTITSTTRISTTTTPAPSPSPVLTHDSSSPAVFSVTTSKPASPRPPRPSPVTESTVELPIYSATKIIEAAIKRAAIGIGVSTEQPMSLAGSLGVGFRRRTDDNVEVDMVGDQDGVLDGDLMAEFSELNYQLAKPDPKDGEQPVLAENIGEIQRLISNLQQLQQLNVSLDQVKPATSIHLQSQTQADTIYLQSLQSQQLHGLETTKPRRQSVDNSSSSSMSSTTTTAVELEKPTTTAAPVRINLDLSLNDAGTELSPFSDSSSTTTSTTTKVSSSTEETRNGSLDDLADSFGPNPVTQEPPPPKKKNGFYFLADWNSFLEVGDGDDQVVVRLSPKIGDPRDFLAV